jgi:hypothetical protein
VLADFNLTIGASETVVGSRVQPHVSPASASARSSRSATPSVVAQCRR